MMIVSVLSGAKVVVVSVSNETKSKPVLVVDVVVVVVIDGEGTAPLAVEDDVMEDMMMEVGT
jgi:hypothetical protein